MKADFTNKQWISDTEVQHVCEPIERHKIAGIALRRTAQKELETGEKDNVSQASRHLETSITRDFINLPEGKRHGALFSQ